MADKTTDKKIPPPPGLPAPPGLSMDVEPTERPQQDTEMGEEPEEGDHKRMRVLTINQVGVLKKVKMGKKDKKDEETEILLNEELEELANHQDTPLDPKATHKGMIKEADSITDFDVYDKVPLESAKGPVLSSKWVLKPRDTEVKARIEALNKPTLMQRLRHQRPH